MTRPENIAPTFSLLHFLPSLGISVNMEKSIDANPDYRFHWSNLRLTQGKGYGPILSQKQADRSGCAQLVDIDLDLSYSFGS